MTFHKSSKRQAKGSTAARGAGNSKSPRLAASFDPEDMKIIVWLAGRNKVPAATVIRDAVRSYVMPFRNNPGLKKQFGSAP